MRVTSLGGRGRKALAGMAVSDQPESISALTPIAASGVDALVGTGPLFTALIHIFLTLVASPAYWTGTLVGFITSTAIHASLRTHRLVTVVRIKPFPAGTALWIKM